MEDDSNLLEGSDIPDRRNITKLRITVEPVGFLFFTASIIQVWFFYIYAFTL